MSPEMILRIGHDWGVDYYGLGAILYEFVIGYPPFYSEDNE
jgi:serine/threonine protein kinase